MWWIPTAIFDRYKVLILTDDSLVDDEIADKLRAFVAEGGKILASGESALYADGRGFAVDLGAEAVGKAKFVPSYLRPKFEMNGALERGVCHLRAINGNPRDRRSDRGQRGSVFRENNRAFFEPCADAE